MYNSKIEKKTNVQDKHTNNNNKNNKKNNNEKKNKIKQIQVLMKNKQ